MDAILLQVSLSDIQLQKEIALASALVEGELALAGLLLVYSGFVVTVMNGRSPNASKKDYRGFLKVTWVSVGLIMASAAAAATWFVAPINIQLLFLVLPLSVVLVLLTAWSSHSLLVKK